jgi:L-alanine-DL-glutamate epimerase-like enolase superfamily enzyme
VHVPPSTIVRLDTETLDLELSEPFGIAGGSTERAQIAIVRLELGDGTFGLGEAAPLTAYNGERLEDALTAIGGARQAWLGAEGRAWRQRSLELLEATRGSAAARCALESALVDALARRAGWSLYDWFGGAGPPVLESDVTIPIMPPESARRAAARWASAGFRTLKIKVGSGADAERVLAAHAGAPHAELTLDANARFSVAEAKALLDALARHGVTVALFEQPVAADDWAGLVELARSVRIGVDESVVTAADALRACELLGPPHAINVKLMKSGIREALDIVAVARAGGMSLMIGGMLESSLAMSCSACFAAGHGGFEFVDLDTPLFLVGSPLRGGYAQEGASLNLSAIELGHGVDMLFLTKNIRTMADNS